MEYNREKDIVNKVPRRDMRLRAGDIVWIEEAGEGIVVGFTSYSGEPMIYIYPRQEVVCVSETEVKRII